MSRLIFARMPLGAGEQTICALSEEGRICVLSPALLEGRQGQILLARVETIAKNINAAFVLIGQGERAFFPLKEQDRLIRPGAGITGEPLKCGELILVQVVRDAMKGKLPAVSAHLSVTGPHLVVNAGEEGLGFSKRLGVKEKLALKEQALPLYQALKEKSPLPVGLILRTSAPLAGEGILAAEAKALSKALFSGIEKSATRTAYELLYKPPHPAVSFLRDQLSKELTQIVTDEEELFFQIDSFLRENGIAAKKILDREKSRLFPKDTKDEEAGEKKVLLRLYEDKLLPLYKLESLESAVSEVFHERVYLKSGGFLVIQPTEALTVIDVNSGKDERGKKTGAAYKKVNEEAAFEIGRQIRLRELSGIILVDFINMEDAEDQRRLLELMNEILKKDRGKARAVDITALQLMELTRQKKRPPLRETLTLLEKEAAARQNDQF